jgi:hypothetical protein
MTCSFTSNVAASSRVSQLTGIPALFNRKIFTFTFIATEFLLKGLRSKYKNIV